MLESLLYNRRKFIGLPDVWDGSISNNFDSGSGTKADPFIVKRCSELAFLIKKISDNVHYLGNYFEIRNNLDLNNILWNSDKTFRGNLDGCGHVISNLKITKNTGYAGLFSQISSGTVKNLGIISGEIQITDLTTANSNYVGAFAGYCSYVNIENCFNYANISGRAMLGGITGANTKGLIKNCFNCGTISGFSYTSGITNIDADIQNCYNVAKATNSPISNTLTANSFNNYYNKDIMISKDDIKNVVESLTTEQMKSIDFVNLLNKNNIDAYKFDNFNKNSGYPILNWM